MIGRSAFILGEEVEAFEAEFADYVGVRHCVGVSSGTAALTLAMIAAGIGPGDEVIVPAMTFIASALAVIHAGATPVLCDVQESDGLLDLDSTRASVIPPALRRSCPSTSTGSSARWKRSASSLPDTRSAS